MFTNKANFSNMIENDEVCVSQFVHKAYIDVNENGTEGAAASGNSSCYFLLIYVNIYKGIKY